MTSQDQQPILILGAGIAGLVTAQALQQKNIDFLLLEAVPEIKGLGAGITLAGNAMKVLHQLGLGEEVKRRGHPISILTIADEHGKNISHLDATTFNKKHNIESIAIHRGLLHRALLEGIPAQKIMTGKKAKSFQQNDQSVTVFFEDGSSATGRALIAADGIHSVIRQAVHPSSVIRYAGYTCWRGISRKNLTRVEAVEMWGPAGRFGYVPIASDTVYWFATRNAPRMDQRMKAFTIADVAKNFENYADPVRDILAHTTPEELLWNDIVDIKPISRYAFDRIVLIGDAAHATTPNMGQGAGLGIEDAAMVADLIAQHGEKIPDAFKNFESVRIPRAKFIVDTSLRLGQISQWENGFGRKLRNAFFRMIPDSINERQMLKVLNIQS